MISMNLSEASEAINGQLIGPDRRFEGVSTDTRTLRVGELFFALQGESFDGHDMCQSAEKGGAAASVVQKEVQTAMPLLRVDDTRVALGRLAHSWREKHQLKVIGITGSNGKTTVKEMTAAILREEGEVLATEGNFNNDIGLPRTLFQLHEKHDFAVLEMGANHQGEIRELAALAEPDVAVITLCAPAHLEGFGSIDKVAAAKGEIYAGLSEAGVAILNADDEYCQYWEGIIDNRQKVKFGLNSQADVFATNIEHHGLGFGVSFTLHYKRENVPVHIPHDGIHNVMNALAASAAALAIGGTLTQISAGLASTKLVSGRLNITTLNESTRVIDDTYNANPTSLMAAAKLAASGDEEAWVVLGDMGELGDDSELLHGECGKQMRSLDIGRLFTVGDLSRAATTAFGENGRHFSDKQALSDYLKDVLLERGNKPLTILVKGSRSAHMETVVSALVALGERSC